MHKYLHRFYTPKKGDERTIYPHIMIGHGIVYQTICEEIYPWVNSGDHGLFYDMLQEEDGAEIGWLLYSTREIDAGALADKVIDTTNINVGLRWKTINIGQKQISQENQVKALIE